MTLIAHSINFRVPFIVGDLLLSGFKKVPFTPPTVFVDVSQYLDEPNRKYFPAELAQKIYVVAPRLAVALSGSVYEMNEFLKELRKQRGRSINEQAFLLIQEDVNWLLNN